jgi:glycine cleavage system H protein
MTKFTNDHEYITDDGTVGITPYAQEQLGDIVFVELPKIGQKLKAGDEAAVVESVKAASEIYSPASGTVVAVNTSLSAAPGLLNSAPETEGWMFRLALDDASELDDLMDAAAYAELTK